MLQLKGTYGNLTTLCPTDRRSPPGGVIWKFECNCGKITEHEAYSVKKGLIISCGCSRFSKDEEKSLIKCKYTDYKWNSKQRGISFNISFKEFSKVIKQKCHYCGGMDTVERHRFESKISGIDRVNNNGGYSIDNIVPCCKMCNYAKRNINYDDFIKWIKRLVIYNKL